MCVCLSVCVCCVCVCKCVCVVCVCKCVCVVCVCASVCVLCVCVQVCVCCVCVCKCVCVVCVCASVCVCVCEELYICVTHLLSSWDIFSTRMEDQGAAPSMATSTSRVHCTSTEGTVGGGGAQVGGASAAPLSSPTVRLP